MNIQCAICTASYSSDETISATICGHVYHNECLLQWLNASKTCPQCRNYCDASFIKRVYFDFAPDEPMQSTSSAVAERNVLEHERELALLSENYEQIDGKFDAKSEEISKLKSLIDDSSEDCKVMIETIDDLNEKIVTLEVDLQDERQRNVTTQAKNDEIDQKVDELEIKLQSIEISLAVTKTQRDQAEEMANQSELDKIQNIDLINELKTKCEDQMNEMNEMREDLARGNREIDRLNKLLCEQKVDGDRLLQNAKNNLADKMLEEMNAGKLFARNNQSDTVAPFCGNINKWRHMIIPILDAVGNENEVKI